MEYRKQKIIINGFVFLCCSITISLVSYCIYQYTLNEDLSEVSYKEFRGTKDDVFPTVSLCLGNPFLKEKLAEYGTDETSYLAFLRGSSFNQDLLSINFSHVTINIVDYIKGYRFYLRNITKVSFDSGLTLQQKEKLTYISFIGFGFHGLFYKCFGLQIPEVSNLLAFRILLSNEIFPSGTRPTKDFFTTSIHLPKQFLLSFSSDKWI